MPVKFNRGCWGSLRNQYKKQREQGTFAIGGQLTSSMRAAASAVEELSDRPVCINIEPKKEERETAKKPEKAEKRKKEKTKDRHTDHWRSDDCSL